MFYLFKLQKELDWLSKIQHQNIISLLGYCIHDDARFLVYEMMHNGSLESQLHGKKSFRSPYETRKIYIENGINVLTSVLFLLTCY